MKSTAEQIRAYTGPAIWLLGFRPFFLGGAIWAAIAMAIWLPAMSGHLSIPTAFSPVEWHVHELIYGYVPAVMAGFLLTAVPNWTGRLPVTGRRLQFMFLIWVIGRIAVFNSRAIGPGPAAVVDLSFLAILFMVIAREIIAGKNMRNLKVLLVVGLLFAGNATFHLEAFRGAGNGYGERVGIGGTILMILLIGGRIIPSFTRNWLARSTPGRLPNPFGKYDVAVIGASCLAIAGWVYAPQHGATAALAMIAAVLNVGRLMQWAGERTAAEPLVLILHVAYAFIPVGFFLVSLGTWRPDLIAQSGALHGWTAGAIALMTIAVMTRTGLGHTGRPLTATWPIRFIYAAALVAALSRVVAAFHIARESMLLASGAAWITAFTAYACIYAPMLFKPRE